jgi:hypothetical protein
MKNPCKTSLMPKPTCPIGASWKMKIIEL